MTWHGKFRPDPMVPKGVWYYMARVTSEKNQARDWMVGRWITIEAPKHPQLEFQARGGELWARWLVGIDEERETYWGGWS